MFLGQGIIFSTDSIISYRESRQMPNAHTAKSAHGYAEFFLEMCLQEYSFMQYDSLVLVCGLVMAARKMVKLLDKWPRELAKLTQRGSSSKELS